MTASRLAKREHTRQKRARRQRLVMVIGLVSLAFGLDSRPAIGDGVGLVLNSKSLPDATVAVIDPESGTSSGTAGSDVNLAVGDIILFRFAFAGVPDKAVQGQMGYLTEYVPPGTDVVGVRILNANGETIEPFHPGLTRDGCHSVSLCGFGTGTSVDCGNGTCVLDEGSISQLIADTGVFFSTDARTDHDPNNEFLTTNNGIQMTTPPTGITRINGLIGDDSGPFFAHNLWDFVQARVFGTRTGNTPHLYGSPVAGPQTHYGFEVTQNLSNGQLEFINEEGPWERIVYPGSLTGTGNGNTSGVFGSMGRAVVDTTAGWDVTPATADQGTRSGRIEGANAVRFAVGEVRTGVQMFAEIALRVNSVPLDPDFNDPLLPGGGGNVDCAEVFGSDISGNYPSDNKGQDNSWIVYMGSPTCVFLRNKFDLEVDQTLYSQSGPLHYTLSGSNLSVNSETGASACIKYDGSALSFVAATQDPTGPAPTTTCSSADCGDTSSLSSCLVFQLGDLAPGEDYEITADFQPQGVNGKDAVTTQAVYSSDQMTINASNEGGFTTQALSIVTAVGIPEVDMSGNWTATTDFATQGATETMTGSLLNVGTTSYSLRHIFLHLPPGWRLTSSDADATSDVRLNGNVLLECVDKCGTDNPILGVSGTHNVFAGVAQAFTFDVIIPNPTTTGLYNIDIGVNYSSSGFGIDSQAFFHNAITVNVGAVRSVAPLLTCPIGSTNLSIDGTTDEAAGTSIRALFNLIERGNATSEPDNTFSVTNFGAFGGMYGGLEVRATAQAVDELQSELSNACEVSAQRACSDKIDNDGDGFTDFPSDVGCDSPTDSDEADAAVPECADGIDNDGDGFADFAGTGAGATNPNLAGDNGCSGPDDVTEDNSPECSDTVDNDSDGLVDIDDPGCTDAGDATEIDLAECQNYIDDDGDGLIDFAGLDLDNNGTIEVTPDPGCVSAFDNAEADDFASADIKARLLVVMDTSGSMNFNSCNDTFTGGDGSTECPGLDVENAVCTSDTSSNGLPDDSRLAKVKSGISDVVAGFGEVDYSLMRFAQRDEEFQCATASAGLRSGGWQGGGLTPCEGGFNEGELLVGFSGENQEEILAYMDGESNYAGIDPELVPPGMDHELRGSGTTPIAGALSSANDFLFNEAAADPVGACRPYSVVLVTDGGETCGGDPVARATDLFNDGFNVYVIGFATSDADVVTGLNAIANAGGTGNAIIVDDSAGLSQAMADIVSDTILTERCNSLDDDCDCPGDTNGDGTICGPGDIGVDEDFPSLGNTCDNGEPSGCFREGTVVCSADELGGECNAPAGNPATEECNGLDDDCDLIIDEGFPAPCVCTPTLEICNSVDDDCDGATDEDTADDPLPGVGETCGFDVGECTSGTLACTGGNFECSGVTDPELEDDINSDCDGLDNDCDTVVDEVSVACYDPLDDGSVVAGCDLNTGECLGQCQTGLRSCVDGAPFGPGECIEDIGPTLEVCNGLDDDCDGIDDNGFPVGDACTNGQVGACLVNGTVICDPTNSDGDGDFVQCTAFPVPPGTEICNGFDDDCDGLIDENPAADPLPAPIGNSCGGSGTSCSAGTVICQNGAPVCDGVVGGSDETCNGLDDDCDTLIDEDTAAQPLLGIGEQCYPFATGCDLDTGVCEGSCSFGATICSAGGVVCSGGVGPAVEETCNGADDDCDGEVDEAASCPVAGNICFEGECVGACGPGEFPCPLDFFCQTIPGEGNYCTSDPCVDLTCLDTQLCDSDLGECFDPCDTTNCPTGTECLLGGCYDCFDPGFECAEDENCIIVDTPGIGECVTDPCFFTECQDGQFCRLGDCVDITCTPACSAGEVCQEGTCVSDLCEGVECGTQVCDPTSGTCVRDACVNKFCPQGTACRPSDGECISDPCLEINCPDPLACQVNFEGNGQCVEVVEPEPEGEWISAGGGGGCGCASSGSGSLPGSSSLLLMGIVGLVLRRRRTRLAAGRG